MHLMILVSTFLHHAGPTVKTEPYTHTPTAAYTRVCVPVAMATLANVSLDV